MARATSVAASFPGSWRGGYRVVALVQQASAGKLPPGCTVVYGDALEAETYQDFVPAGCMFVHLVGVAHPGPTKIRQFQEVDLRSVREAIHAATGAVRRVRSPEAAPTPLLRTVRRLKAQAP